MVVSFLGVRDRWTDRQTDRQTDGQTDRHGLESSYGKPKLGGRCRVSSNPIKYARPFDNLSMKPALAALIAIVFLPGALGQLHYSSNEHTIGTTAVGGRLLPRHCEKPYIFLQKTSKIIFSQLAIGSNAAWPEGVFHFVR